MEPSGEREIIAPQCPSSSAVARHSRQRRLSLRFLNSRYSTPPRRQPTKAWRLLQNESGDESNNESAAGDRFCIVGSLSFPLGSTWSPDLRKGLVMSSRFIVSLAASAIVGIVCIATISTDAFAYRRGVGVGRVGVYHGGVYRGGVYRGAAVRRGVAVGVGAAAVGAAAAGAYGAYRCGYYPYGPCY